MMIEYNDVTRKFAMTIDAMDDVENRNQFLVE